MNGKIYTELDGLEVESDENFYIMGTDARAEIECTSMDKLFVFKSNDKIFFKCPISNEIEHYFLSYGTTGFYLVQSEITIDEEQVSNVFR